MLDLRLIRSDTEGVRAALERRNAAGPLDAIVELDEQRRSLQTSADELRAERNRASQAIGEAKRAGRDAAEEQAQAAGLGTRLAALDEQLGGAFDHLPRVTLIETEYQRAVVAAELAWVERVMADLRSGELAWSHEELARIAQANTAG